MADRWLLAQWFEHVADAQPDHLALADDTVRLTYGELEVAANRVAHAVAAADRTARLRWSASPSSTRSTPSWRSSAPARPGA